jgi:integrase
VTEPAPPSKPEPSTAVAESPLPVEPVATHHVVTYSPLVAAEYWPIIGQFVTGVVDDAADQTLYSRRELFAAATPLVLWAWQSAGLPLDREVMFSQSTIERFIALGIPQYRTNAGRNTIRSRLLRLAETLVPAPTNPQPLRPLGKSAPSAPYRPAEIVTLKSWARTCSTAERIRNAETLLALGFGAGLSGQEIIAATMADLTVDDTGVHLVVRGERPREVTVLSNWERALRNLVALSGTLAVTPTGETMLFRQNRDTKNRNSINDFVARSPCEVVLTTRRMHATWVVHHLDSATPLLVLMRAAGVQSHIALARYFPFVRDNGSPTTRAVLRNASPNRHP